MELTPAKRKKLKKSQFAVPADRAYPIHDRSHAANALARASQQGVSTYHKVLSKVCAKYADMPACHKKK